MFTKYMTSNQITSSFAVKTDCIHTSSVHICANHATACIYVQIILSEKLCYSKKWANLVPSSKKKYEILKD